MLRKIAATLLFSALTWAQAAIIAPVACPVRTPDAACSRCEDNCGCGMPDCGMGNATSPASRPVVPVADVSPLLLKLTAPAASPAFYLVRPVAAKAVVSTLAGQSAPRPSAVPLFARHCAFLI